MGYPLISQCPVCQRTLTVAKLHCRHCGTTLENEFELPKIFSLSKEQLHFIEVFLVCRGNIKEVEKELGISYPTVRGKLNEIIAALGYENRQRGENDEMEKNVISLLENGEITADEAIKMLKNKEARP